jgi:biotin carboxyl carrier protein
MKKFQVTVNGNTYEVEVEELQGTSTPSLAPVAPRAAAPAPKVAAPAPVAGGEPVTAPMPGKIVDVKVSVGQSVNEGDLIAILEAMKMENEIFAPKAGKVASVNVTSGAMVEANDVIVTLN